MHTESARQTLLELSGTAIAAVSPFTCLRQHVFLNGNQLEVIVGNAPRFTCDLGAYRRIFVLGAGKGAAPLAEALEELLVERIDDGIITVKYGHGGNLHRIRQCEASHPLPDESGIQATKRMLALASQMQEGDFAFCVFTGGASALTPAPVQGITLEDLASTSQLLLGCGATIHEINTVRKHLSQFSGGNLARAIYPAHGITFLVSDVIGDNPEVIASGPTTPDPGTFTDALEVIVAKGLTKKLPARIVKHLEDGAAGKFQETPKPDERIFKNFHTLILANNQLALQAAAAQAKDNGYTPVLLPDYLVGEARECAAKLVDHALEIQNGLSSTDAPTCLVAGGETTVTLRGNGKGGRNQEMAVAAKIRLAQQQGIHCLFLGTDGTDGPTDAAGGFAHAHDLSPTKIGQALSVLNNNDSYNYLAGCGQLHKTGPTKTNVMDMAIVLVYPRQK